MQLGGATEVDGRHGVLLKTSRSQVDGILDPKRDITLSSLQRAGGPRNRPHKGYSSGVPC